MYSSPLPSKTEEGLSHEREKDIMNLRFGLLTDGDEKTQKQVADIMGISQSYISRLEKKIIKQLKKDIIKMINE